MRILVVWENSGERKITEIVASQIPSLIGAALNSAAARLNIHRPPVSVRAIPIQDLFSPGASMPDEVSSYMRALERSVFE